MTRAYSLLSGLSRQGLGANRALCKTGVAALGVTGLILAGCADQSAPLGAGSVTAPATQATSHKVGVLLPLSGANAALGHELLAGAQLALSGEGLPADMQMDVHDTAAIGGAASATSAALQAGDGILLGPLTSGDTAVAAPPAQAAGIPVLAFTSDITQGRPGVWVMGITPEEQVQQLVAQAKREGRQHFAALLPDNALGHAMGNGLVSACRDQGLAAPSIAYHNDTADSINQTLRQLSAYDARVAAVKQAMPATPVPGSTTTSGNPSEVPALTELPKQAQLPASLAAALGQDPSQLPPTQQPDGTATPAGLVAPAGPQITLGSPPFDALVLADIGLGLKNVLDALAVTQVNMPDVRIMGPGLWASFASKLGAIKGAWYAAPDPTSRQAFVTRFMARNHHMPKPLADMSYDAAMATLTVARSGVPGYPAAALTRVGGFAGVDGTFTLLPDGRVRRALGVFEVIGNGSDARMISTPVQTRVGVSG
ncbi:ABC transporter substrate-binding protein [Acetobacter lambici]|nr:ABC transporter substrate-binding protein [Acetobacter lambici]